MSFFTKLFGTDKSQNGAELNENASRSESAVSLQEQNNDGEIVAAIVVNQKQEPEYQDGNWSNDSLLTAVIHRLCVKPKFQGRGIASTVMRYAENNLKKEKYNDIRLDAFSENPYAIKLYKSLNYKEAGEIYFRKGRFILFEKVLQEHKNIQNLLKEEIK